MEQFGKANYPQQTTTVNNDMMRENQSAAMQ